MTRWIPVMTAVIAVVAGGVVHGLWTDRWMLSAEPARSAARLSQVPLTLDDWDGEVHEFKDRTHLAGRTWLRYVHRRTGKAVTVLLVCDRPAQVAIHTPDVCYGASGYLMGTRQRFTLRGGAPAEFWTAPFRKSTVSDHSFLRIFWAWNQGDGWQAADDARAAFAGQNRLFKLYLIHEMTQASEPLDNDPCVELMRQLLPQLQPILFCDASSKCPDSL